MNKLSQASFQVLFQFSTTHMPNEFEKYRQIYNKRSKSAEHIIKSNTLNRR